MKLGANTPWKCLQLFTSETVILLTYSLTPWSRILFMSLSLLKHNLLSYGTRRFVTVFTQTRHWTLSWDSWMQSDPSIPISLRSILMLSFRLQTVLSIVSY